MYRKFSIISVLLIICVWLSCKVDPYVPTSSMQVSFNVPKNWPQPFYAFANNKLTYDGFQLGRRIFYDERLSIDGTVSCAFCHQNFAGFANLAHYVSHGVYNKFGTRNAPEICNMAWSTSFFWDGGVKDLDDQPINPMTNPVEMGETMPDVISKISKDKMYPAMFTRAFGNDSITSERIFKALSQFMVMMVSSNSRYDKYKRGEVQFNQSESNGYVLYQQKCAQCHPEPLFTDYAFHNIGMQPGVQQVPGNSGQYIVDSGREHVTNIAADRYKFKTPTLRNVQYSSPYLHDGRCQTLLDVLNFFDSQVDSNALYCANLDPVIKASNGIHLTASQKTDMVNFLNTLTDSVSFMYNPLFLTPNNYNN